MNVVTSLILRQMRTPLIILLIGYSIAILGMVLTPGLDDNGKLWHMSFFDAIYFVSFTATTIGFGEIPYELSNAQRMWALVTIYITVISWFYALGKTLSLIQDPTFRDAIKKSRFAKQVHGLRNDFILICGFGESGNALVRALTEHNIHAVVIEIESKRIKSLPLIDFPIYVPGIQGDARDPEQLIQAGLQNPHCAAVIAVTASDETNLKIAITSKLLNPEISVLCRSELKEFEENMLSFGTDYIINPFETFADTFSLAIQSPSLHLLYDWLTGVPNTLLNNPIYINNGHWILCGFGRFGQGLYKYLNKYNIPVTIIDPSEETRKDFLSRAENRGNDFIIGTGFDAHTLTLAGIKDTVGLISGSDNDSNNLSIIMTALEINPDLFIVARQNKSANHKLFVASKPELIMEPSEIIARKIRTLLTNPLMVAFLNKARHQDHEWSSIVVSRLSGILGDSHPNTWTIHVTDEKVKALYTAINLGRILRIGNLLQDPRSRERRVTSVPLLLKRGSKLLLMPTDDIVIKTGDEILFCGTPDAERSIKWTVNDHHTLNYIMSFEDTPDSFIWRKLHMYFKNLDRRNKQRPTILKDKRK